MELHDLITRFSVSHESRMKAIFSSLLIISNRLQTIFDRQIPEVSLKQFMLLSLVRQAPAPLTLTQLGELLGCSRQNVKKLAQALEKKGYLTLERAPADGRALCIRPAAGMQHFFLQVFSAYEKDLALLFRPYSEEETALLFQLLMRLYAGLDCLEQGGRAAEAAAPPAPGGRAAGADDAGKGGLS